MTLLIESLRRHWVEYLIEAAGLGLFMISAGICVLVLETPGWRLHEAIPDPDIRRGLIGIAMGLTAVAIIYSPWGQRSGAHLNPAVTLAFLRLGKLKPEVAIFYILAQFVGGALGTVILSRLLGDLFLLPPVSAVATLPGDAGEIIAFVAEAAIAFIMMSMVLLFSRHASWMRYTGLCAGLLVAIYIAFEAPFSGMSLNPARSVASALPSGLWHAIWIYLTAPPLGMLLAAELHLLIAGSTVPCAKLHHSDRHTCHFHCHWHFPHLHLHREKPEGAAVPTTGASS